MIDRSSQRIPQRIDHFKYTDQGMILDGVITQEESSKDLLRFQQAVLELSSDIRYHLEFDVDLLGIRYVTGNVTAQVVLQCQRCMENFTSELNCDLSIAFICNDTQEKHAENSNYDIFRLAKREYLDPRILLEDELLLALPQIAIHKLSDCHADVLFLDSNSDSDTHGQDDFESAENNPFAILQQLKK